MSNKSAIKRASTLRRRKRQLNTNGDRSYFAAVRKIRRNKIDEWQLKHKPERFRLRLIQLSLQATKRQMKQEARDRAMSSRLHLP